MSPKEHTAIETLIALALALAGLAWAFGLGGCATQPPAAVVMPSVVIPEPPSVRY
jgi:hypothetical protein